VVLSRLSTGGNSRAGGDERAVLSSGPLVSPRVPPSLSCTETRIGDRVEVAITGELMWTTTGSLITTVERVIDEATAHLVLNLSGVPFMDSTGLAAFVKIRQLCDDGGCTLQLTQLGNFVTRMLTRTGLYTYLNAAEPAADTP
jgi:anti-sigma B factor antagonist